MSDCVEAVLTEVLKSMYTGWGCHGITFVLHGLWSRTSALMDENNILKILRKPVFDNLLLLTLIAGHRSKLSYSIFESQGKAHFADIRLDFCFLNPTSFFEH